MGAGRLVRGVWKAGARVMRALTEAQYQEICSSWHCESDDPARLEVLLQLVDRGIVRQRPGDPREAEAAIVFENVGPMPGIACRAYEAFLASVPA